MSIPFSNTTLRIPRGFANLLEGLAREVLRNQPEDIPSFAARYFESLLIERERTGFDPTEWGAKLEDRYYNNRGFNELAPTKGDGKTEDNQEESGKPKVEEAKRSDTTADHEVTLTEEEAATKIQACFRGFRTRKEIKSTTELGEKEKPTDHEKKESEQAQ